MALEFHGARILRCTPMMGFMSACQIPTDSSARSSSRDGFFGVGGSAFPNQLGAGFRECDPVVTITTHQPTTI
jgi:hypothetical protein